VRKSLAARPQRTANILAVYLTCSGKNILTEVGR